MKKLLVVIGMFVVTGMLSACGGGGGGGGTTTNTTSVAAPTVAASPTPIATQSEAARTVNASTTLAAAFASGSAFPSLNSLVSKRAVDQTANGHKIMDTVRDIQLKAMALQQKPKVLSKAVNAVTPTTPTIPDETTICADGGSQTLSFSINLATSSMSFTQTSTNCKESNIEINGTITVSGLDLSATSVDYPTLNNTNIDLDQITVVYKTGSNYSIKTLQTDQRFSVNLKSMTDSSMDFVIDGSEAAINYVDSTSVKQIFDDLSLNMIETIASNGIDTTTDITMDGTTIMDTFNDTAFSIVDTRSGMTFESFHMVDILTAATESITIDGTYAIQTIPSCMDGTFAISTQSPIVTNNVSGDTTSGQMTVNGVVIVFYANGSVSASINGTVINIPTYTDACTLSF